MATVKISELPVGIPTPSSVFPFVEGGVTYQGAISSITYNAKVEITYSDFINQITQGTLSAGTFYLLSDFRTCYDQPDFDVNGISFTSSTTYKQASIDPIVVLATSNNTISSNAFQPSYPKDRIQYDWTFSATEITNGIAFGRITERIDEFNNRTDYDHRTILFKRYKTYFYELNNPLQGRIDISNESVIGLGTNFINDLYPGDVIYVIEHDKYFRIESIDSTTGMTISGNELITDSGLIYYYAESYIDGNTVTIPYTHTRMTDPPVDTYSEASLSDYLMDGSVQDGTIYFGSGSTYFTNLYPGLFVLSSYDNSINTFTINGNLGADGDGTVDFNIYNTTGTTGYTAYIKRVFGAGDPSVNQIIIINTDGTNVQYNYSLNTNNALQKLYNLSATTQISYLLTSTIGGSELILEDIQILIENYLLNVDNVSLSNTLSNLNLNYSSITQHITGLYLFNDIESKPNNEGGEIEDGGNDIFDSGNTITTDILELIYPYRCYEFNKNNIPEDDFFYRELKTFQYDEELISDGHVTSINNFIGNNSQFFYTDLGHSEFLLSNNVFDKYSYSNTIGDRSYNNSTYRWFSRNKIGNRFYDNRIYGGFYANVIGEYCYSNNFTGYLWRNQVGEDFRDNKIGSNFQNNFIRNSFNNNIITENFYKNNIGNGFNENYIQDYFYGNFILNGFKYNNISGEFENNQIGNNFYNNTTGNNFKYNSIKDYFQNNIIGDGFGFGGSSSQGNIIGNYFENNTIDEYFYNNTITDGFTNNQVYQSFQMNNVKIPYLNGVDFTYYYGNITAFTYSSVGTTATDSIYTNLEGTTNGEGVDASFNVEVVSGAVVGVTGNTSGKLYSLTNTITILGSQIGGIDVSDDVVVIVTGISPKPSVYEEYNCDLFKNSATNNRLSYFDGSDTLTIKNINE